MGPDCTRFGCGKHINFENYFTGPRQIRMDQIYYEARYFYVVDGYSRYLGCDGRPLPLSLEAISAKGDDLSNFLFGLLANFPQWCMLQGICYDPASRHEVTLNYLTQDKMLIVSIKAGFADLDT